VDPALSLFRAYPSGLRALSRASLEIQAEVGKGRLKVRLRWAEACLGAGLERFSSGPTHAAERLSRALMRSSETRSIPLTKCLERIHQALGKPERILRARVAGLLRACWDMVRRSGWPFVGQPVSLGSARRPAGKSGLVKMV
jgi:hypothetical protein